MLTHGQVSFKLDYTFSNPILAAPNVCSLIKLAGDKAKVHQQVESCSLEHGSTEFPSLSRIPTLLRALSESEQEWGFTKYPPAISCTNVSSYWTEIAGEKKEITGLLPPSPFFSFELVIP